MEKKCLGHWLAYSACSLRRVLGEFRSDIEGKLGVSGLR